MGESAHAGVAAAAHTTTGVPVELVVEGRHCVIVGGGNAATIKARSLLAGGAAITVISPEISAGLAELLAEHSDSLRWVRREFRPADLDQPPGDDQPAGGDRPFLDNRPFLVVAATGTAEVDDLVSEVASRRSILVARASADHAGRAGRADVRFSARGSVGPASFGVNVHPSHPALAAWVRDRLRRFLEPHEVLLAAAVGLRADLRSAREADPSSPWSGLDWKSALDAWMLTAQRSEDPLEVKEQLRSCLLS